MSASKNSHFQKGIGVYTCRSCKRKTRSTGRGDNEHVQLCAHCFDLGGLENEVCDGNDTIDSWKEAKHLIETIRSLGGEAHFHFEEQLLAKVAAGEI